MGLAAGILSLFCLGAKKHAIKECQPPSWNLSLPVWSHSHVMSPNGKLDPENIGIAVGISLKSRLEAKIHAFEVVKIRRKTYNFGRTIYIVIPVNYTFKLLDIVN